MSANLLVLMRDLEILENRSETNYAKKDYTSYEFYIRQYNDILSSLKGLGHLVSEDKIEYVPDGEKSMYGIIGTQAEIAKHNEVIYKTKSLLYKVQAIHRDMEGEMVVKNAANNIPPELRTYLNAFMQDYQDDMKIAFIMMQFSDTPAHDVIIKTIKETLEKHKIRGLRADDKEYTDDLFSNIRTYMHGADFGIAVFERILEDVFNPNVSLEVGYMQGLGKNVCYLKDSTLQQLQTDLLGKLYKPFDPQRIKSTLPKQLEKWLSDKGII